MHWPSLSIIIPSFNQGQYIERTLLSILKQEYAGDVEVIVADGGSSDQTVEVLKKYPQTRWWSKPDKGFVDAVTQGIAVARGEILAIQSSDDFYLPGAFQRSVQELMANPTLGLVAGCDVYLQADRQTYFLSNLDSHYITPRSLLMQRVIPQHCAFFRRDILEKIGGLRTEVDTCADIDLWYRALHFFQGKFIPHHTAVYQFHANQRTKVLNTWHASLLLMVESCESNTVYSEKFVFGPEDKKNLYKRWEMHSAVQLNSNKQKLIKEIKLILRDKNYSKETKEYIYQLALSNDLLRTPQYINYYTRATNALANGTFFQKLKRKIVNQSSVSATTHIEQATEQNIDIHWWQL